MLIVEAVAFLAVVVLMVRSHDRERELWAVERERGAVERRELADRIQSPERLPYRSADGFVVPDVEPDDINKVGEIHFDPEYVPEV